MENKEYQNKTLTCRDCGKEFIWKIGEQKFYEEKGLREPTRCRDCRQNKKKQFEEKTQEQKNAEFEKILERWKNNTVFIEKKDQRK